MPRASRRAATDARRTLVQQEGRERPERQGAGGGGGGRWHWRGPELCVEESVCWAVVDCEICGKELDVQACRTRREDHHPIDPSTLDPLVAPRMEQRARARPRVGGIDRPPRRLARS
jgi:hypothetical protein